jgi:hypothetical protein
MSSRLWNAIVGFPASRNPFLACPTQAWPVGIHHRPEAFQSYRTDLPCQFLFIVLRTVLSTALAFPGEATSFLLSDFLDLFLPRRASL